MTLLSDALASVLGSDGGVAHLSAQIDGLASPARVEAVSLDETLGAVGGCSLTLTVAAGAVPDVRDLFGHEAVVTIDRGPLGGRRTFRGVVRSGSARATGGGEALQLDVVPALGLLQHVIDSRVYQNVSAPELVTEVVRELLGDRGYEVRLERRLHMETLDAAP